MKKLGLAGLALITLLGAPSSANALVGAGPNGEIEVFSVSDPRYTLHRCQYQDNTLEIKCDQVGNQKCFVDGVYDPKQGKTLSPFSVDLPPRLVLISGAGTDYCIEASARY